MIIDCRSTDELDNGNRSRAAGNIPEVSIGMPVYNGEPFLREALDSLLAQNFTDFELIISDNASTDGTEVICREYAERDARIRYIRQLNNIGATANFLFVLNEAVGEYFMWAAADDVRSDSFLKLNFEFLSNNKDYIASTSPVRFQNGEFNSVVMGDFALDDEGSNTRIYRFFTGWHANGRFYSLIRRDLLKKFPYQMLDILGADWLWVAYLAYHGKMANINQGFVILGNSGISNSTNIFKRYNINCLLFFIPFYHLSKLVFLYFKNASPFLKIKLIVKLMILNFRAFKLNLKWSLFGGRV